MVHHGALFSLALFFLASSRLCTNAYGAPGMDESENLSQVSLSRCQWVVKHPTLRFCLSVLWGSY